jgi:hypothetical protein
VKRLKVEYSKTKPSQELVTRLMALTFTARRDWITNEAPHVSQVVEEYPFLATTTQV